MLNPFPIQFLSLIAYLILRVLTGLVLLTLGYRHFKVRKALSRILVLPFFPFGIITTTALIVAEVVIGTLFILGAYTQIAALLAIGMSLKMIVLKSRFSHTTIPNRLFYVLLFAISCSLFITGAGALAFDLPI